MGYPVCKDEYAQALKQKMAEKTALVISTTYCGYCNKAKSLLGRYNIEHSEIVLDNLNPNDQMEISNCIYGRNQRFVPFIYLKSQPIGGYGELVKLQQSGVLESEEYSKTQES